MIERLRVWLLVALMVALLLAGLGPWAYNNTDAPSWCHGELMKYTRGCIGWTVYDD